MLQRLLGFRKEYSSVDLHIEYLKEIEIVEKLHSGVLDFGVITNSAPNEQLSSEILTHERIILVTASHFKQELASIEDLYRAQFIAYRADDPLLFAWISSSLGRVLRRKVNLSMTVNSHRSMIDCLLAFDAFAVMPWQTVEHLVDAGVLRVASKSELNGSLNLVWVPSPNERKRMTLFRKFILSRN